MRRILLFPLVAALSACNYSPTANRTDTRQWFFQMPMIHDTVTEYLVCADSLSHGTVCTFQGLRGIYEEAQEKSFLNLADSSIQWPYHDAHRPAFLTRK